MKYHISIHSDPTMTKCWMCGQTSAESDMTVYINAHNVLFPCCSGCVKDGMMRIYVYNDLITYQEAQVLLVKAEL